MNRQRHRNMKATGISWLKRVFFSNKASVAQLRATANRAGPQAQNNLGILLLYGERFGEERAAGVECFRTAAEQGDTLGQYNLAMSYQHGQGVARDLAEAQRWLLRAADCGDGSAQYYLGTQSHRESLTKQGAPAEELKIEALKWLLLAAAQGHHNAERSCESLILGMDPEHTAETNRRVTAFNGKTAAVKADGKQDQTV
jgi:TPR repeat protein